VMGTAAFSPPTSPEWMNYSAAWARGRFSSTVLNSVIITVIKVPLGLLISAMAAYALSRIRLPGGKAIFLLVLFGTMLPFQVMLAPLFTLVNGFGLINTKLGAILPYLAFGVPYQVFILHGFFSEIPKELSEAARVDGASHFTIFRRIFLPASLPVTFINVANITFPKGTGLSQANTNALGGGTNILNEETKTELFEDARLSLDAGKVLWGKPGIWDSYVGYRYWYNKFGTDHNAPLFAQIAPDSSVESSVYLGTTYHFK